MHHTELVSELAVSAGLIENMEGILPKTAANRQNRVIMSEIGDIILPMTNGGAGKVSRNFAYVSLHHIFNRGNGIGFFGKNYLADHSIDIGIG